MSNARSPREVCSTTIGTSGLTVLASFRFVRSNPSRAGRTVAMGLGGQNQYEALGRSGRPELLARLRLAGGDRLGGLRDQVQRAALGEVLLEGVDPPGGLQPLQQLLGRAAALGGVADGFEEVLLGGLDLLGLDDGRQHGLAAQRLGGVLLAGLDDLLLLAAGDP